MFNLYYYNNFSHKTIETYLSVIKQPSLKMSSKQIIITNPNDSVKFMEAVCREVKKISEEYTMDASEIQNGFDAISYEKYVTLKLSADRLERVIKKEIEKEKEKEKSTD